MNDPGLRIAFGYDSHRVSKGRPLLLGGVLIEGFDGLMGHSDADVLCHAVIDALCSAARLGDIGTLFPADDPALKGADSLGLLRQAAGIARIKGFEIINCDCTLVAERPKISSIRGLMAERMAFAMGISPDSIFVKGKTNEGMDSIGKGEGMAAYAVMLVKIPV